MGKGGSGDLGAGLGQVHIPRRSKWWIAGLVGNAFFIALPVAFWIVYRRMRLAASKKLRSNPGGSSITHARHTAAAVGGGGGGGIVTSGATGGGGSGGGGAANVGISSAIDGGGGGVTAGAAKGLSAAAAADGLERGVRRVSDKPEDDVSSRCGGGGGGGLGRGGSLWVVGPEVTAGLAVGVCT